MSRYLFGALTHNDAASFIIQHGSVGLADHLEDVIYGIVHIPVGKQENIRRRLKILTMLNMNTQESLKLTGLTHEFFHCNIACP